MPDTLTRKALYDLVWSKPRTTLAKEMGVSDVWIGKQCKAMNVPAPPPGYWANLHAEGKRKAKYVKPPLTYTVVERLEEDRELIEAPYRDFPVNAFDVPVPEAHQFTDTVEEVVARHFLMARSLPKGKVRGEHPIVQKLRIEDDRRAALSYSWNKPMYQSPTGKRALDALNQLMWHWTALGFKPTSSGTRNIVLRVAGGGFSAPFHVQAVEPDRERSGHAIGVANAQIEFRFENEAWDTKAPKRPPLHFKEMSPKVLDAIVELTLLDAETQFRKMMAWWHKRLVELRTCELRQVEEARERERRRLAAEQQELIQTRQRLLHEAIRGIARSEQIRGLVEAMEAQVGQSGSSDLALLGRWKVWALRQADSLDPRVRTAEQLGEWLGSFRLHDQETSARGEG